MRSPLLVIKRKGTIRLPTLVSLMFVLIVGLSFLVAAPVAAQVCTPDQQGADDEPGQKDLSEFCEGPGTPPFELNVTFNFDDTRWTGSNTGDACVLFDTDDDTFANFALCVTLVDGNGQPAYQSQDSPRFYQCDDDRVDRCTNSIEIGTFSSTCSVNVGGSEASGEDADPFAAVPDRKCFGTDCTIQDAYVACLIEIDDISPGEFCDSGTCSISGAGCSLDGDCVPISDSCAIASQVPNSDPSDCIRTSTQSDPCLGIDCTHLDDDCNLGVCDTETGVCFADPKSDATPCDDGNACTTADTCASGTCVGGPALNCDDGDVCTTDSCNPATGCVYTNNSNSCDDGNACTTADTCASGTCVGGPALNCDDGDVCTTDSCNPAIGCQNTPVEDGTSCSNGLYCDGEETCQGGVYTTGAPPDVDDGIVCTNDSCDEEEDKVLNIPDDSLCDDGEFCNGTEVCDVEFGCQPGTPPEVDDGNECTEDSCDEDNDVVVHDPDTHVGEWCMNDTGICQEDGTCLVEYVEEPCGIEIYQGGYPVPPLNTYNMPGRRGLALTCGDTVQFDYCYNCDPEEPAQNDPCPEWSMSVLSGTPPAGTSIDPSTGLLTIGPDCTGLIAPIELEITVTDPCNFDISSSVSVFIGEVTLDIGEVTTQPGTQGVVVEVSLDNPDHQVKGIQARIVDNGDYLTCTNCMPDPDNAPEYNCVALEQGDGDCLVVMTSTNPAAMIEQGSMRPVLSVEFDVAADAQTNDCIDLWFYTGGTFIADKFGCALCPCLVSGEICFAVCGDVYPRECDPEMPNCGDGVVDIFDILEEIDFVLQIVAPSPCQAERADVPIGQPPYCGCEGDEVCVTDGNRNIFDALVVIDMSLGKANCCDYCATGKIH